MTPATVIITAYSPILGNYGCINTQIVFTVQPHTKVSLGNQTKFIITVIVCINKIVVHENECFLIGSCSNPSRCNSKLSPLNLTINPKIILNENYSIIRKKITRANQILVSYSIKRLTARSAAHSRYSIKIESTIGVKHNMISSGTTWTLVKTSILSQISQI